MSRQRKLVGDDFRDSQFEAQFNEEVDQVQFEPSRRSKWKDILMVILGNTLFKIAFYWRRIVFIGLIGMLGKTRNGGNVNVSDIAVQFAIWQALAFAKVLKNYLNRLHHTLLYKFEHVLHAKIMQVYLESTGKELSYWSIRENSRGAVEAVGFLILQASESLAAVLNLWVLAHKIGGHLVIPIVISVLYHLVYGYVIRKCEWYKKQRKRGERRDFFGSIGTVCSKIRSIKFYGWEKACYNLRGGWEKPQKAIPLFWAVSKLILSLLEPSVSRIGSVLAIVMIIDSSADISSYLDVAFLMTSVESLIAYVGGISKFDVILLNFKKSISFFEMALVFDRSSFIRYTRSASVDKNAVQLDGCVFSWGSDKFSLDPITLTIKSGDFVTVVGRIGSGKSSFLSGLCGEMPISSGNGHIFGQIGYVCQKPHVMNDTFRENVLMGREFDKELFWKVVEASALTEDVQQFPARDQTEIGSNGINLSGGQIVRLALARALYVQADVYIFDDLLSAVDAHVERQIIERVLMADGIIGNKTRILVTHAEHLVPLSNTVISFSDGRSGISYQDPEPFMPATSLSALEKLSTSEKNSSETSNESSKRDNFTIHPEIDHPQLSLKYIWRFIELSGYGTVSMIAVMCILDAYGTYYIENLNMDLILDTNPKTIRGSMKRYLVVSKLKREAPSIIEDSRPPADWPSMGTVEFCDYKMRYRKETDLALKGISFSVKSCEKIGIVGRTGAGKSSITFALMRMVEAAEGKIMIDGIDISTIGLHDLRSCITVIPQDPALFEGTIRENLDPYRQFTDDQIWEAIRTAQIDELVNTPTGIFVEKSEKEMELDADDSYGPWIEGVGLNKWVEYYGSNFSVGQRQLVSLCRALLLKRKIVILDEATANVDSKTDEIMQRIFRSKFNDCTVLTIAHRLGTIMDSDRILVINEGQAVEFDAPKVLLANKASYFSGLVESMKLNQGIRDD
ncbi:hypothetical protein GGF39_002326 [Coemansia sp. RSA 1721]|nr:hypothetical protein GGF39_002326 [Coemansia sp. RSA 1721]